MRRAAWPGSAGSGPASGRSGRRRGRPEATRHLERVCTEAGLCPAAKSARKLSTCSRVMRPGASGMPLPAKQSIRWLTDIRYCWRVHGDRCGARSDRSNDRMGAPSSPGRDATCAVYGGKTGIGRRHRGIERGLESCVVVTYKHLAREPDGKLPGQRQIFCPLSSVGRAQPW
jgi:hypothetical protein